MVKKIFSLAFLLMCVLTMSAQTPLPLNPQVRHGVLPNGLSYYLLKNTEPEGRANFYIAQKVGSTLENQDQLGLAHFLEHMAFNGSKNFPGKNMLNYLQSKGIRFGADINAYTSFDETVYNINSIPTSDEALMDSVLLALHDWSCALSLEGDEIEAERGVIHEEWRSLNDANTRMFNAVLPQLFDEYQYAQMPIGTMEVVLNFPHEALRSYYEKWYRPDQQGIVIVGDFDVDVMEKKVIDLFSKIEMPENAAERTYPPVSDNVEPKYITFEDPELQRTLIQLSFKKEKLPFEFRNSVEGYVQSYVVESITSAMINNRLSEMSQKADCPFVYAGVSFDNYWVAKTKYSFNVTIIPKDDVKSAFEVAMSEIVRACKTGFNDSELQRVKDQMLSSYEKMYNEREKTDSDDRAQEIIRHFIDNEPTPGIEAEYQMMQQMLPMIPVQIFNDFAKQILTKENQVLLVSQPQVEGKTLPAKEEMLSILDNAMNAEYEAYVDEVITDPLIEKMPKKGKIKKEYKGKFGTTVMELSNGAKVIVKPTDYAADQIAFNAFSIGGQFNALENKEANPSELKLISAAVEASKFGTFDNIKLRKYLAGKNVGISFQMGKAIDNIYGQSTVKDLETMLQLNYLYFTDIRPDAETYNATIEQYRAMLKNAEKNPNTIFMDNVYKTWYDNNPIYTQLKYADLDAANYETMLNVAKKHLDNAADYTFTFVGNVDIDALRPLVEQYIATLPANKKKHDKLVYTGSQAKGQIVNDFKQEMETPSVQVFNVYSDNNIAYSIENEVKLSLLSDVLDIVYTNTLREEEGGTYSPATQAMINPFNNEWTVLYMFVTGDDSKEKLCKRAHEEFLKLLAEGTNEENFNKVKDAALNQYQINSKNNSYWQEAIYQNEMGQDVATNHEAAIKNLTLEEFNAFIKNLYNGNNRMQVIMNGIPVVK